MRLFYFLFTSFFTFTTLLLHSGFRAIFYNPKWNHIPGLLKASSNESNLYLAHYLNLEAFYVFAFTYLSEYSSYTSPK